MNFVALDFETANANQSSICQIGIAEVENGEIRNWHSTLVNPEAPFDFINVDVHGIDEDSVRDEPKLRDQLPVLVDYLNGKIVVSHSAFDRVATLRASERFDLTPPDCEWLDSARIVRRAWPDQFGSSGYGLRNVANVLGIDFTHHDAGEDARACAEIVIRAVQHTGLDLNDWKTRINQPIRPAPTSADKPQPNPDGPFFGASLVFTGALTIPRREATAMAAAIGFQIKSGVSPKTDVLIVGDQDAAKLAGHERSSKHRKAEQLIRDGHKIDIFSESDFRAILDH